MPTNRPTLLMAATLAALLTVACAGTDSTDTGITVTPGTWSYSVTEEIPLPGGRCSAKSSGTATVSAGGAYSITFPALSCSSCTMSASTSGTITTSAISGSVSASIAGSGCSSQQPTPRPASVAGDCHTTTCTAQTASGDSFAVSYTLTPS